MWKKLREAIFSRPIEELQTIVEDGGEIDPKDSRNGGLKNSKPSIGRKPVKLYTTKDGLLIETTRKYHHPSRPYLLNSSTNSSSSGLLSLENESESTATGEMDRARRQMRERVLNRTGMPDIHGKLRESPLFPRRPLYKPHRVDTTVVIATKSKGNPAKPVDPITAKTNPNKLSSSTTNIPKLDVVATSVTEDSSEVRQSVSGTADDSKTGKVGQNVRVRDVKKNLSAPLPEMQRRNNIKDIDNQLEEEPMVIEKKCINGNTVKFSRPSKCAWSIHPVYKWEAPSLFQRAFLPNIDTLETLLNKQVLMEGELTYLLGCVRASHFGSSTNPGFYITSGFYIWVTDFDEPDMIARRKLRVKLEIHGIKKMEVNSDDIYVRVYQLSKVDHGLIGRVHEMVFPNKEMELKQDLKGEIKLKFNSSEAALSESSKDDNSAMSEVKKVTSLNSSLTSVKKISGTNSRNMNFIKEVDDSSQQRGDQTKTSTIKPELPTKTTNASLPTSVKIDVTKIFTQKKRLSDVQLWVTLERTDSQTGHQNSSLLGNKKSMGLPPFVKFKGVQFVYERALVMNKN